MKIVIDIEEGRYNWIMSHASNDPGDYVDAGDLFFRKAIESGTVLPKGHGRLVDENHIVAELVYRKHLLADGVKCGEITKIFDNAVVIDADALKEQLNEMFDTVQKENLNVINAEQV